MKRQSSDIMDEVFSPIVVEDLQSYRDACTEICRHCPSDRWVYRGQSDATWPLETRIERSMRQKKDILKIRLRRAEDLMLREFKRHLHRHVPVPPKNVDRLEWLALMQHHGAPTRLLDFTFSQYVALFF